MLKYFYLLLLTLVSNSIFAQLNGTYTIGGVAPDYPTMNAAVSALTTSGVSGPVTFNIRAGYYYEQVSIPEIAGANAVNKIIFQGEDLDSSLVHWKYNSTLEIENFVCRMLGADFISLKHLSIYRDSSASSGSRVVIFQDGASNNRIEHCVLTGRSSAPSSGNYEVIYSPVSIDTANYIAHNLIKNGGYSIRFLGTSGNYETSTRIEHNVMSMATFGIGIAYDYYKNLSIKNNVIPIATGIDLQYGIGSLWAIGNKINATNAAFDVRNHTSTSSDSVYFLNNMFNSSNSAGIWMEACQNVYVHFNTLSGRALNGYNTAILYIKNSNAQLVNNIIYCNDTGKALMTTGSSILSDYNIFKKTGGTVLISFNGASYANLPLWQAASIHDAHSFEVNPNFISASDLHILYNINANGNALNLGIVTDIDGDTRGLNPDIGADEFDQPDYDVGALSINGFNTQLCGGTYPVLLDFRNYGELDLTAATIQWTVNGSPQTPFLWTGNLASGDTAFNIQIGLLALLPSSSYNLDVWLTDPNGQTDTIPVNDHATFGPIHTMLSGNYTVGGVSPDYLNFNACIADLQLRGVCGPVVFNVRQGIYNEYLNFNANTINGPSAQNTVTFQSELLDSSSVELAYIANNVYWMVNTPNLKHFRFNQLTFRRTYDPWSNDNNLFVLNDAGDVQFTNCAFHSSSPYSGEAIRFNGSHHIVIDHCYFGPMAKGIINSAEFGIGCTISNNIFDNKEMQAVYLYQVQDSTFLAGNLIKNDVATSYEGFAIASCNNTIDISGNTMLGKIAAGIKITCLYANQTNPPRIYNNFISLESNTENVYGIEVWGAYYLDMQYNSFKLSYGNGMVSPLNCSALMLHSPDTHKKLTFANNCIESDSTNKIFIFPALWDTMFVDFDRNNFYLTDPGYTVFSDFGWPAAWNANSIAVNPIYSSDYDLHVLNPQLALGTANWTYITSDIDGDNREHPTVGADEGDFIPINAGVILANVESLCDSAKLYVKVFNYGLDTLTHFDLGSAIGGNIPDSLTWTGVLYPGDTSDWILVTSFGQVHDSLYSFVLYTILPNDSIDYRPLNDTLFYNYIGVNPLLSLGNDLIICSPDTALLTFIPNSSYSIFLWNTGSIEDSIFVDTAGIYTLTATNSYGCQKTDSVQLTVGGNQAVYLSNSGDTLYSSLSEGLIQWFWNGSPLSGQTDDSILITSYGDYYISYIDSLGCQLFSDTLTVQNTRDAGVIDIFFQPNCDSTSVYVNIKNYSDLPLSSFDLALDVNGLLIASSNWVGTIPPGDTLLNLFAGKFENIPNNSMAISCYTSNPNGLLDLDQLNDSTNTVFNTTVPVLDLGPDLVICRGESTTLHAVDTLAFQNFSWSTAEYSTSISVSSAGTYYLSATDILSCAQEDSIEVYMGGVTVVNLTFSGQYLYTSLPGTYTWFYENTELNGEVNDSLFYVGDGTYYAVFIDTLGCLNYSDTLLIEISCVAENSGSSVFIHPNPATEQVVIHGLKSGTNLLLQDMNGKILFGDVLTSKSYVLKLERYAPGTYILVLEKEGSFETYKLLILE